MYRTHTCGELNKKNKDKKVKLSGWVDVVRIHGKVGFVDLRDRYGITQIFFNKDFLGLLKDLKRESVILVEGVVKVKPKANPKLKTGEIEVSASKLDILSLAEQLPLELDESIVSTEETRLKYRYLDLRKERLKKNLELRHKVCLVVREFLDKQKFFEIETPFLAKSTPEGARDYLVPSRVHKGKFYALPQSPQLFKQLLMMSGYDRYFQVVRCFRDEDLRADRQPEFTQIDMEMSFVEQKDVLALNEKLMKCVFKKVLGVDLKIPFERISYDDAMKKYGKDSPDLRKKDEKFKFVWVIDFPAFEYSEEEKRYKSLHHPFTMLKSSLSKDVKSYAYDLVLNGVEVAGGSIRIHDIELQKEVFKFLGLKDFKERFGFLLNAMKYGCPPLGGIAYGLDRLVALMCGEGSIREVIAFPKNKSAEDLMLKAPSKVDKEQLDELGLKGSRLV